MNSIKVAIVGVGNCASALVQGKYHYQSERNSSAGLMFEELGGYRVPDLEFVAAFDIDDRKVGKLLNDAIFSPPNCTTIFCPEPPKTDVRVSMGRRLDGVAEHMAESANGCRFIPADLPDATQEDIVAELRNSETDVLVNLLPVGAQQAAEFYMACALEARVAVVNCIPVFIASEPSWEKKFREQNIPIIGDDIKSQVGATITHRALAEIFGMRGAVTDHSYQLNVGGNTDFRNMLDRARLNSKKISKTEAVQSNLAERLPDHDIHVGPSDFVSWLNDNKLAFIRMEGAIFGGAPINMELRLSVEDSPNSAGVVVDAIRCCKVALDQGRGGALIGPSAFFCKHPPEQYNDSEAREMVRAFVEKQETA